MTLYRQHLRHLLETAPHRVQEVPASLVRAEARRWLEEDDLYALSQLVKHVSVELPPGRVAVHLYGALRQCRVDDFLFLLRLAGGAAAVDPDRVAAAYAELATRGNVAGLEAVAEATGVRAVLDHVTAERAFNALAAMGRPAAMDYVRQLSGATLRCEAMHAETGFRVLLLAGQYDTVRRLRDATGVTPRFTAQEVGRAVNEAETRLRFRQLATLAAVIPQGIRLTGFAAHLGRTLAAEAFSEVPALVLLCEDAVPADVPADVLRTLASSAEPDLVRYVYEHPQYVEAQRVNAASAYTTAVESGDLRLVRSICESTGTPLRPVDVEPLLVQALAETDVAWVCFAARSGPLPSTSYELQQLFLFRVLLRQGQKSLVEAESLLGARLDAAHGRWLHHLERGESGLAEALRPAPDMLGPLACLPPTFLDRPDFPPCENRRQGDDSQPIATPTSRKPPGRGCGCV